MAEAQPLRHPVRGLEELRPDPYRRAGLGDFHEPYSSRPRQPGEPPGVVLRPAVETTRARSSWRTALGTQRGECSTERGRSGQGPGRSGSEDGFRRERTWSGQSRSRCRGETFRRGRRRAEQGTEKEAKKGSGESSQERHGEESSVELEGDSARSHHQAAVRESEKEVNAEGLQQLVIDLVGGGLVGGDLRGVEQDQADGKEGAGDAEPSHLDPMQVNPGPRSGRGIKFHCGARVHGMVKYYRQCWIPGPGQSQ